MNLVSRAALLLPRSSIQAVGRREWRTRFLLALAILPVVAACGAPPVPATGADGGVDLDGRIEPEPDGGPAFVLFSRCETDEDCHGDSTALCGTVYPGGLCTVECTDDSVCGESGQCFSGTCRPRCTRGGRECEPFGSACIYAGDTHICTPSCWPDDRLPEGTPACVADRECNEWRTRCVPPAELPTGRGENGAPCETDADCLSEWCLEEIDPDTGAATGYIGGTCVSFGTQPPDEEFVPGEPMPRSNCVEGSIVVPRQNSVQAGDWVICWDECASAADCRPGYQCFRGVSSTGPAHSTGACWPVFCSMEGMECPPGYACQIRGGLSQCEATP